LHIWLVMLLGGLLTFGMRLSFIYLFGRFNMPLVVRRALRFVPPAVLTAITVPELLLPGGKFDLSFGNYRMLAGLAAILVAWKTRSALLTILTGMAVLLILEFIF
jgi:branched-subunit amino acid transport protein